MFLYLIFPSHKERKVSLTPPPVHHSLFFCPTPPLVIHLSLTLSLVYFIPSLILSCPPITSSLLFHPFVHHLLLISFFRLSLSAMSIYHSLLFCPLVPHSYPCYEFGAKKPLLASHHSCHGMFLATSFPILSPFCFEFGATKPPLTSWSGHRTC